MTLGCLLLLKLLLTLSLPFLPLSLLLGFPGGSRVQRLVPLLLDELLDQFLDRGPRAVLLHHEPVVHDGVLQLEGQLVHMHLSLVVVVKLASLPVLVEVLIGQRVAQDVVESWLDRIWIDQLHLVLVENLLALEVLSAEFLDVRDANRVVADTGAADGIRIDAVVHQEGVVVDDAAAVELLNDELLARGHACDDVHLPRLDHVHLLRGLALFTNGFAFLQAILLHLEDPLVFHCFGELLEVIDSVEAYFQEDFQGIIVEQNRLPCQVVQHGIDQQQVVIVASCDFSALQIVDGCNRG